MELRKALIVEDDTALANAYRLSLQTAGFEVDVVYSAHELMDWLAKPVADLVLLDMNLPDALSFRLLPELRASLPPHTRFMAVTGNPRAVENNRDEYDLVLLKPVSLRQLRELALRLCPLR